MQYEKTRQNIVKNGDVYWMNYKITGKVKQGRYLSISPNMYMPSITNPLKLQYLCLHTTSVTFGVFCTLACLFLTDKYMTERRY
jgi:hypothetical protein